jgi:hypothetical protein
MTSTTLYHLEFAAPPTPGAALHYYFGSIAGIFDVFTKADIGCQKENIWNHSFEKNGDFKNACVTIRKSVMYRKSSIRTNQ